jgi:hypothetical protein
MKEVETIFQAIREAGFVIMKKEEFDEAVNKATDMRVQRFKEEAENLRTTINKDFERLEKTHVITIKNQDREIKRLTKMLRKGKVGE